MPLSAGRRLGPYEVLALLGAGGMGEVYRARDPRLGRDVAIKVLPERFGNEPDRRRRFEREARAAGSFNHPNIVTVFDVGSEDGRPFVVCELLEGETLRERIGYQPTEVGQALEIGLSVARGLCCAHQAGILHRDLKPENVFLTRDGRTKILDFGLAKLVHPDKNASPEARTATADTGADGPVGTPAYMSPEQIRYEPLDGRADLFAVGGILYELLSQRRAFARTTASDVMAAILRDAPPAFADLGVAAPPGVEAVVRRCLEKRREDRFGSAQELEAALFALLESLGGTRLGAIADEERSPYPGLRSFTESEAAFFFGREVEVQALWARLRARPMLAVIGASGAGKTSFLRAGVLPARPKGWAAIACTPGSAPLVMLGQALAPELAGDPEALRQLVRFDDPDTALSVMTRWRQRHGNALVAVDQFEELFTLNAPDAQDRFARLLGRLASDAGIHVLLALRDDFLMRCHDHQALVPVFADLTPLGPLAGDALRRAVVEPAARKGVRIEEEALVEELMTAVRGERGALPLLAFAMARLWEGRDRQHRVLTRGAYEDIGGVAGCLAQHAEATIEQIGPERQAVVRDLFRSLVTAEGTRSVVDRDELASACGDRGAAEEVLGRLIDARLLTSYDTPAGPGTAGARQCVEIVHESLLRAWPRLVRWQTQDADGAQLRDQLRQAAQLWQDRGKTEDLLWSGQAYRDFALWRERYPAPLTAAEDAFTSAMTARATRQRRRRRAAVAAIVGVATTVAIVTSVLWRRADTFRREAEAETRQREAAELLALGRLQLDEYPTGALAYAIASLERADNAPARRFAVEALWRGPTVHVLTDAVIPIGVHWSGDGRWLALGGTAGLAVLDRDTGKSIRLASVAERPVGFSRDGTRLVTRPQGAASPLHLWSIPEGKLLETWPPAERRAALLLDRRLLTFVFGAKAADARSTAIVRERPIDGGPERTLGRWETRGLMDWGLDPTGEWLVSIQGGRLLRQRLDALAGPPRVLGRHEGDVSLRPERWIDRIVTADAAGELRVWNAITGQVERTFRSPASARAVALDRKGRFLATAPGGALPARSFFLFDLQAPPAAEPAPLLQKEVDYLNTMAFHPEGQWLATGQGGTVLLWNLAGMRSLVLRGQKVGIGVAFTPDGRLVSTSDEGVMRVWSLSPEASEPVRVLWSEKGALVGYTLDVDARGRFAVVAKRFEGALIVVPLDGSPARVYRTTKGRGNPTLGAPRIDPDGQRVAFLYAEYGNPEAGSIRITDLATGEERILRAETTIGACAGVIAKFGASDFPAWLPDGRLVSDGATGLRVRDLATGSSRQVRPCRPASANAATSVIWPTPDSRAVVTLVSPGTTSAAASDLSVADLATGASRDITSHGGRVQTFALDPTGTTLVTGEADGLVRVGPLSGEGEPHLLYGHSRAVTSVAVSPDGRWIASGSDDETIRLWPMPQGPPLQTLPHDALLAKLRALTNLRVLADSGSATGYKVKPGPFPGWANVPEW